MAELRALFLLSLCHTLLTSAGSALEAFAPSSRKAELGTNVLIPCTFKVPSTINRQYLAVLWEFQGTGIVKYDNKGLHIHPRVHFDEKNIAEGAAGLYINNISVSDIGTYRCTIIYSPDIIHKDVDLLVYAHPSISALEKINVGDEQKILCSVTGFYPERITVQLIKDGTVMSGSVISSLHKNNDNTFSINSSVILPSTEKPKSLSCKVQHDSLTADMEQNIRLVYNEDGGGNTGLVVGVISGAVLLIVLGIIAAVLYKKKSGPSDVLVYKIHGTRMMDGESTTLYCTACNCSQETRVKWIIKNKDGATCEITENELGNNEEEQPLMSMEYKASTQKVASQKRTSPHDITSKLTFIPSVSRHLGSTVTCRFITDKKSEEKTHELKDICAKPQFREPVQFTITSQGDVQLAAGLDKFYPQPLQITWASKKGQAHEKILSEEEVMKNPDATCNLTSKCTVSGELFKDPTYKVTITWKHESMDNSQTKELSAKDFPWRPQIGDYIESDSQGDTIIFKCSVSNYFPDALTVKWFEKKKDCPDLIEVTESEKYTIPKMISNRTDKKTFTTMSCLSVKKSLVTDKDVGLVCRVDHPSLEKPTEAKTASVQPRDTGVQAFFVNNIQGPQKWYGGEKVVLYCAASYCNENTQVIWIVTGKDGAEHEIREDSGGVRKDGGQCPGYVAHRERTDTSDIPGLLDVTSCLGFTPSVSKHKDITISCKITCDGRSKQKTFQRKQLFAKPKVLNPIELSLTDSDDVLCALDIEEFYPSDIQIKWNHQENLSPDKTVKNAGGTYNVHSECKLRRSFFKDPQFTVKVSWKHESMDGWEWRQMSAVDKDFPWKPELREISIPNLLGGIPAVLKCEVSNVFPDVMNVKWLKRDKDSQELFPLVLSDKYSISDITPERQTDNTFTYKACLRFTPSIIADHGTEFICRVEHPSLEKPAQKRTGPLSVQDVKSSTPPQDKSQTDSAPLDKSQTDSAPVEESQTDSAPLDKSQTDSAPVDKSQTDSAPLDKSQTDSAPLDKSQTDSAPLEESQTDSAPETLQADSAPHDGVQDLASIIPQKNYQRLIVGDIRGSDWWTHEKKMSLQCPVSYCPEDVTVVWTVTEGDGNVQELSSSAAQPLRKSEALKTSSYFLVQETDESDVEGLFNITSIMTFIPTVRKHYGSLITCTVTSDGETKAKEFQPKSVHAKPQVLDPVKAALTESGEVTCALTLQDFYPKHITVTWATEQNPLKSKEDLQENADHTYNVCSQCTVQGSLFKDPNFKLSVTWSHKTMKEKGTRVLSWRDLANSFPWHPVIQEVPVPHVLMGQSNTLQYNISSYFPDAVTVSWYKKEKDALESAPLHGNDKYKTSVTESRRQPDSTYSCTASLLFTPTLKDQESEIICRVEHPSLERPLERSSGPLRVQGQPKNRKPVIVILGREEVKYSLVLERFYPRDIQIKWICGSDEARLTCPSTERYHNNMDKSYSVLSECTVSEEVIKNPNIKTCVTWSHESMDDPRSREVSIRDKDYPYRPDVKIQVPPLYNNTEASLECEIYNYFPGVLNGMWLKKDRLSGETHHIAGEGAYRISNQELGRQPNNTYSYKSCLIFTPTVESDQGAEFIFQVTHPSLEQPMQKSTGALQMAGFPWHPVIQEVPVPHVLIDQSNTLQYNISSYFPDAVTVSWYKKEKGALESAPLHGNDKYKTSVTESQRQPDYTYSSTASLLFTPTLKDQESEIICRVEHPSLERPLEKSSGPLRVQGQPQNRKPVRVILGREEVKYSLVLERFYPKDIQIKWICGSDQARQTCPSTERYTNTIDKSYSIISECTVSEEVIKNPNFKTCVTWSHESMDDPRSREVSIRDKDYPYRPEVKIQVPPLYNNTEASLECTISNCFPGVLNGMWLKKDRLSGETHDIAGDGAYRISNQELGRQPSNTYCYKSCLIFTPTVESDQGAEFIFQVAHPSVEQPIQKSTGALQIADSGDKDDDALHQIFSRTAS